VSTEAEVEELPVWTLDRVDAEKMKLLALLLADPNPLHFDPESASRLGIAERPVNQGPSNMAMLVNLLRAAYPTGRPSRLRVQLRGSVIAGQAVRAGGRVTERVADGDGELVRCEVWLRVEGAPEDSTVLSGQAEVRCPAGTSR
jgi:acyl dehydratase